MAANVQLKAVLSGRVGEVEARIEGVAREMQALLEAQRQRRSAEQEEMDALAARKQSLDEEEADCTQVRPRHPRPPLTLAFTDPSG